MSGLKIPDSAIDGILASEAQRYQRRTTGYANYDYDDGGGYGGGGGANSRAHQPVHQAIERSGYGHSGHGHGHKYLECCELVVDPLTFASLLASILGGTLFLNVQITMILGRKRRKRSYQQESVMDVVNLGETSLAVLVFLFFSLTYHSVVREYTTRGADCHYQKQAPRIPVSGAI